MKSAFPVLAEQYKKNIFKVKQLYNVLLKYFLFLSIPMSCGTFLLGKEITVLLYGQDYEGAGILMSVLGLAIFIFFLTCLISWTLTGIDKQNYVLLSNFVVMLMNILLNFLFIPKYGALAAAVTTLVCGVIQLIIMSVALSRTIPLRNEMNLAKIMLATIVMSGVIISIKNNVTLSNNFWNVILTVLLAIFTYNLVAIILGTIRRYELRLLFKN